MDNRFRNAGRRLLMICIAALPACAVAQGWQLLSRESGCVDPQLLVRAEHLARAPNSPDDFVRMVRERGDTVSVGLPSGFPAELEGKVVQVRFANGRAPIFVRDDVCRNLKQER